MFLRMFWCLSGSTWGANAKTLRTAARAIVYSTAEYATPVWNQSSHAKKLDVSLNDTMRIITGCVKPIPTHLHPVLSGIAPANLRRNYVTNKISYHAWANKEHPLHNLVPHPQSPRPQRLSRATPSTVTQQNTITATTISLRPGTKSGLNINALNS